MKGWVGLLPSFARILGPDDPPVTKAVPKLSLRKSAELLTAKAPSPLRASRPPTLTRCHVLPLSAVSQYANLPLTGPPSNSPSRADRLRTKASQKPSGSGLVKMSAQVRQPSTVL